MKFEWPEELIFMKNKKAEQRKSSASMAGKVCVITGATSGVGFEALKKLAQGNADIIMVCRNQEKAKRIREDIQKKWPVNIDIVIADFSIISDVRKAAEEILNKYKQIHVLINSAGLHSTTRVETIEGHEQVFCVNHLASFLFTKLLMDRMKESAPSRIIQVNSEGHRFNGLDIKDLNWKKRFYTGLRSYGASKTAQLMTVWELADDLQGSGVTINALHPGDVRTNIGSNNGWLYKWFLHNITWHSLKEPSISGEAIYYLAADPDMLEMSGKFYNLTVEEKPAKHALNRELGKKIYDISMQLTGL
ncbi:MAG: SDR family NAD(P)-dependent oxidoreductase [Dethiosulfatibacter sp.]|nr:SDR family NAD(P)-dependent oxidoreductase [Dethiosulfatibacter sp.]